jgi:hypothetical protein
MPILPENGNILQATKKTGGFGGSRWTRFGYRPPQVSVKEDCLSFNPATTTVKKVQGRWKIVDGSHWVFDFGNKEKEARTAFSIIKKYRFSRSCFVGRPKPSFEYLRK